MTAMSRRQELITGYLGSRIPQPVDSFATVMKNTQTRHMDFQNSDKMTYMKFNAGKTGGNGNDFRLHDNLAG